MAVCGLRKTVRLYHKSWFVRQKVLGANIHETEGLLERNIAKITTEFNKTEAQFRHFRGRDM